MFVISNFGTRAINIDNCYGFAVHENGFGGRKYFDVVGLIPKANKDDEGFVLISRHNFREGAENAFRSIIDNVLNETSVFKIK